MVLAAAQKVLSPEKTANINQKRKDNKSESTYDKQQIEEEDNSEMQQETKVDMTYYENENSPQQNQENHAKDLTSCLNSDVEIKATEKTHNTKRTMCDKLPDFNTFRKELSEKTKTYWGAVISDYTDFTNWTCLLQTVTDTEDNIEASRAVYNCFLRYYPYCYGYWKKFADIEKKNGNFEETNEVFQKGVAAIPVSIDLWVHYLNFTIQQWRGKANSEKVIRSLFDQAIEAAGMEFKSNKLWDAYIEWEKALGNLKHVTEIYDKLIATPTAQYMKNWQRFKNHLEKHNLIDILPTEEYSRVMQKVDFIPPGLVNEDEAVIITTEPPGESAVEEIKDEEPGEVTDEKLDKGKADSLKRKIIAERESIFVETADEIKKRWKYEDAIKRPYFHVKPLEKSQIKNWKEYLDYEIREGGHKRICFLFERCLVACALYEEFWIKFIDYLEPRDKVKTHDVYRRACTLHLLKKYKINLDWATFEEKRKNYVLASEILANIDTNFPGMIMIVQRRVGLARRMKRLDDVIKIYEKAIDKSELIEDKIFYSIKFSNFLAKFCNDKKHAREILWKALDLGKKHKRLYLQLLDLEMHYGNVEIDHVERLFSAAANDTNLSNDFQDNFYLRKIEFYEDHCDDISKIVKMKESYNIDHKKREAVKRYLSNSDSYETPLKAAKMDTGDASGSLSSIPAPVDNTQYTQEQQQWYQNQLGSAENADYYNTDYWANYAAHYAYQQQQQK